MSIKKECGPQPNLESCKTCGNRLDSILCSNPDVLLMVEKARVSCRFKAGQIIFYSGNDPLGIFTIQSGLVKLEVISASGAAHTLRLVGPGGTLGYRSMFANEPYHASAVAVEDCELCFVPKAEIMNIFKSYPELAMKLLSHISKDLRMAEEKWMDQMDKGASERIAEALIFLQDHFAHQNWTRREIAQWAGTTPETVIRTLSQFEKDGLIDQTDGRSIRILSRDRLKDRAEIR
ncbi:Crp/Fnr family transcriptional regulator [Bdellovibrio bacteriovorus]|uniref:Transcriptional regulatory protein n=1 Tax=Bdellovibrio bacteriovorus (strain ATCC 15356 / DSM 50701 / NCIMB 9529 / HD100) TaxID=264462 RepID=Q6MK24_BDEBA|nr:Crp/Fnr family transcriptional regulator [Bdellovibrio bacteriovorus]CAE80385.1 transcriptional regulatory protein [Bdellovibrio bacteriovorus HD100]